MACGDGHPIAKGCFRINRDDGDGVGIGIGEGPPLQRIDRGGGHPEGEGSNGRVTCIGEGASGGAGLESLLLIKRRLPLAPAVGVLALLLSRALLILAVCHCHPWRNWG